MRNGQIALLAERKTVAMTMMVNFPEGEAEPIHRPTSSRRLGVASSPARNGPGRAAAQDAIRSGAEITTGLLPLNGIFLSWDYK